MGHLFILFPIILILGIVMHRVHKGSPGNLPAVSLRNFFFTWAICSGIMGVLAVFFGTAVAIGLSLAFGVPFIYFAGAVLVFLPFLLYQKSKALAKFFALLITLWGILVGVIIYVNVTGAIENVGIFQGLFTHIFGNIKYYHLLGLSVIFVPLGVFFLREGMKSVGTKNRIQALLIGSGLIIGGVAEGFHAWVLNPTGFDFPDFIVPIGFLLILLGIVYPKISKEG